MNFILSSNPSNKVTCQCLALAIFESDFARTPSGAVAQVDRPLKGLLQKAAREEGFKAKSEQSFVFHTHGRIPADRVLLLGLGSEEQFVPELLRMAAGRAAKMCQRLKVSEVAFALPPRADLAACVQAVAEGFELGEYRFDRYKTEGREDRSQKKNLKAVRLLLAEPGAEKKADAKKLRAAIELGQKIAQATNWARDLVNEPAGVMTPSRLAEEAKKAAEPLGLEISIQGRAEIQRLKMGMFLGVAQGSAQEPKLVHVWYTPKSPEEAKAPPVVLVGKAITFDSGGLSLKTAEGMVDMKTDMAGSAAVLAAIQVVSHLKPPFPVHVFLGACENMPSGTAYRPGDVLISKLGKTVEITNTDAEGRLVLGDVLALATELKPSALIDIATLTGACIIALGNYITGVFGEDDALVNEVLSAGRGAGEELWRLPMLELQKDALRSEVADMKNAGERWGGATNAAMFLKEFVANVPWVHLDIAGPSQSPKERGYYNKGATGCGVRTFVEFIRRRAAMPSQAEVRS